jgi:hypothetical protein
LTIINFFCCYSSSISLCAARKALSILHHINKKTAVTIDRQQRKCLRCGSDGAPL